ncbi:MAG: hypothetical protein A49_06450 [Methyloceanibacter sp.]|nr:MAG: hypothetical protein A49_06450 [Methyloceanibacter sp.]
MAGPLSKELFDQGLNAWNQEADKLEEAGKNIARPSKEWDDWRKNAKADFCGVVFAEKS